MNTEKRYSQACENNKDPILEVLQRYFGSCARVLEIGSGTGQHGAYFSSRLPHLFWQCSDMAQNHPGIHAWVDEADGLNLGRPLELDVSNSTHWEMLAESGIEFDCAFSANTAHIMSWENVCDMFSGVAGLLEEGGLFLLYGPFNRDDRFTSPSNAAFDARLKDSNPAMGIRNDQDVIVLANNNALDLVDDIGMPANNRILVFKKHKNSA